MKCFVAFWERLMENQRRRVAIRPALQPTGARIAVLERPSQMKKRSKTKILRVLLGAVFQPHWDQDW